MEEDEEGSSKQTIAMGIKEIGKKKRKRDSAMDRNQRKLKKKIRTKQRENFPRKTWTNFYFSA